MKRLLFILLFLPSFADAQTSCEPNMDFELGNYSNWYYYIGSCCPGGNIVTPASITTPPAATYFPCSFALTGPASSPIPVSSGIDPYGGFPVVGPGTYSIRIGADRPDYHAEKIEYHLHVPAGINNYNIFYHYAIVLEDPAGHTTANQPRFTVQTIDSATGLLVPCGNAIYYGNSVGVLPGWAGPVYFRYGPAICVGPIDTDVYYKPWSIASINLSGYGGHTILIQFAAADCGLGAHFGYAYVEMSCGLFAIDAVAGCSSATVQLSAPIGFEHYTWYDSSSFTTSYGTGDTISIPAPSVTTTYAVIVTPWSGFGCTDTLYTTIYPSGSIISGSDTNICVGNTITLPSASAGGTWTSSNTTIVTVISGTGTVTGLAAGSTILSYLSTTCTITTETLTVNPTPVIIGSVNICVGDSATLTATPLAGTWSSSNSAVASISIGGIVYGISNGSATITYTLPGGCYSTITATVTAMPSMITGITNVCPGAITTLSDTASGGVWSSSNTTVATIGPNTGIVSFLAVGTSIITYTMPQVVLQLQPLMLSQTLEYLYLLFQESFRYVQVQLQS